MALESLASGVPVVGARAGGIPFAVQDGVDGLLFEPNDAPDMARQISRLLEDEELRGRLGAQGRASTEQYSWRAATERLVEFYELAIDRHWTNHVEPAWRIKLLGRPMPRAR